MKGIGRVEEEWRGSEGVEGGVEGSEGEGMSGGGVERKGGVEGEWRGREEWRGWRGREEWE